MITSRPPDTYLRPVGSQRSPVQARRCPATVKPRSYSKERGRARTPALCRRTSALGGRAVRAARAAEPTSSAHQRRFFMVKLRLTAALLAVAVLALLGGATAAAKERPLFPVTLKAANGTVTIAKRPVRIVSLSPTATENLFAVGAGRQVVAVDELSNYPKRAPRTKLSGFTPNAEAIAGYPPDLVVVHSDAAVAQMERLGITVLQLPAASSLFHAYAQLRQLGRATG